MRDSQAESIPDPLVAALAKELRAHVPTGNRAVERTLVQLHAERRLRSAWMGAAAAVIVVGFALVALRRPEPGHPVRFALQAPASRQVSLVGDFNDWSQEAAPLRQGDGEWFVTLRLRPGRYRYSFLVDGQRWVADQAIPADDDDFDTPTSVITVAN